MTPNSLFLHRFLSYNAINSEIRPLMEDIINFACSHAHTAPWIIFCLILLAGLNIPISEDALLIAGGVIASTCVQDETIFIFAWLFCGCVLAAWETYWIGRIFGPKLYDIKWFERIVTPQRIKKLHAYYERFGILTFMVIRFCPGGVRNALFLTSGLCKMPFWKFALRDGFSLCISATLIFSLGYYFGTNYKIIFQHLSTYSHILFIFFSILLLIGGIYLWRRSKTNHTSI